MFYYVMVIQVPKQNVSEHHVYNFCIMHFFVSKNNKKNRHFRRTNYRKFIMQLPDCMMNQE